MIAKALFCVPFLLASASAAAQMAPTVQQALQATILYKSVRAPTEARVQDLLGRMALEEKVAQLQTRRTPLPPGPFPGSVTTGLFKDGKIDDAVARRAFEHGTGQFYFFSFKPDASAETEMINTIQAWVVNTTRLGIPLLFSGEGLHGAALPKATTFPQAIALGSTWNRALVEQAFSVTSRELRATGVSLTFSPVFDLGRDPRFGRIEEMCTEDPIWSANRVSRRCRGCRAGVRRLEPTT
jgi:beta-glucosidase